MQAARASFVDYLVRLDSHLDTVTLEATLGLMLGECRAEIRRLRALIALDRLGDGAPVEREAVLAQQLARESDLATVLERVRERGDLVGADDEAPALGATVIPLRG